MYYIIYTYILHVLYVYITRGFPEKQNLKDIYIDKYIGARRFIIGIVLSGFEGQEVPKSVICKLNTEESYWCNSVPV